MISRNVYALGKNWLPALPGWLCAFLLCLGAWEIADAQAQNMMRTHPGHVSPPLFPDSGFAPMPPQPPPSGTVVAWFRGHPDAVTTPDQRLTEACRAQEFNQYIPLYYRALFQHSGGVTQALGWAVLDLRNLRDPNGFAEPGVHYYFDRDMTRHCKVYTFRAPQGAGVGRMGDFMPGNN